MKIKQKMLLGVAWLMSISSLSILAPVISLAAGQNCIWTGATNDYFNTATNWSDCGGGVPQNGDELTFDNTNLGDSGLKILENDIVDLQVSNINFIGSIPDDTHTGIFRLTGNSLTLSGSITNESNREQTFFDMIITASADVVIDGSQDISMDTSTFNIGAHNLTINTEARVHQVAGSGDMLINAFADISGATTGNVYINSAALSYNVNEFTAANITVAGDGRLILKISTGSPAGEITESTPITLNSTGGESLVPLLINFAEIDNRKFNLTNLTLNSDSNVLIEDAKADDETHITAALNGHSLIPLEGSQGKLFINNKQTEADYIILFCDSLSAEDHWCNILNDGNYFTVSTPYDVGDHRKLIVNLEGDINLRINKGGILGGKGKVGSVVVQAGGKIAPGESPGCLSTGNLVEGGIYDVELGGNNACTGYDQLKVTGTVDAANGTLSTIIVNGYKPSAGETFVIIDNDGSDAVTGTFSGLPEGSTFIVDGYVFKISYVGGDGNDISLAVMSVPSTPNTGFQLIMNSPILTLLGTVIAAGSIAVVTYRYNKLASRR